MRKKIKSKQLKKTVYRMPVGFLVSSIVFLLGICLFFISINRFDLSVLSFAKQVKIPHIVVEKTPTPALVSQIRNIDTVNPNDFCIHVPVLMYHHIQPLVLAEKKGQSGLTVDPETFDAHLAYIQQKGYRVISAKELVDALYTKTQITNNPLVITIDDGYKDVYEYAYPILHKYGMHADLLIATGLIGGEDYLSWDQVKELQSSGLFGFINHTWSHYNVSSSDQVKIAFEIDTAKEQLEHSLGISPDLFGYPYGNMGGLAKDLLREKGYKAAFSTLPGSYHCSGSLYSLPRIRIGRGMLSGYGL